MATLLTLRDAVVKVEDDKKLCLIRDPLILALACRSLVCEDFKKMTETCFRVGVPIMVVLRMRELPQLPKGEVTQNLRSLWVHNAKPLSLKPD